MWITDQPYAFIDTETSGLTPEHEVLEVAVVFDRPSPTLRTPFWDGVRDLMKAGVMAEGDGIWYYHTRIKMEHPERAHPEALAVNRYSEVAWADAPTFKEVAPILVQLLRKTNPIGHNVGYDLQMLGENLLRAGHSPAAKGNGRYRYPIRMRGIDTQTLAFARYGHRLTHLGLEHICQQLGVRDSLTHSALSDAMATREVYHLLQHPIWYLKARDLWRGVGR